MFLKEQYKLNAKCNFIDVADNKKFLISFQKTMLLSLHEDGWLTFAQYTNAIRLLEKKYSM